MQILIYVGVSMAAAGFGGVVWCLLTAMKLRKSGLTMGEARPLLNRMAAVNMGSVAFAFFGLAMAVTGLILR
ncbi:MAG: hypothetical protein ACJA1L_000718 [Paracoccaceae bacterium]|jgi:hypothetical protein